MASLTGCPSGCYDSLFPDISLDCEIWRPGILLCHRIAIPTPDQCRASVADAGLALSRRSPCTGKVDSAWKKRASGLLAQIGISKPDDRHVRGTPSAPRVDPEGSRGVQWDWGHNARDRVHSYSRSITSIVTLCQRRGGNSQTNTYRLCETFSQYTVVGLQIHFRNS